jgi:N-acetylglutamate synthase-like GNAT family acetyltransferase
MDTLQIRPAEAADADAIFTLLEQFAVSYCPQRPLFDRHLPVLLAAEEAELLVASLDGRVVGYALAFRLLTLYANGPIMELQELMVAPLFRSRRIGRRLVEAIVERAWERGCVEVTVPTRRAVDYYRKLGFIETATYLKRKREESSDKQ